MCRYELMGHGMPVAIRGLVGILWKSCRCSQPPNPVFCPWALVFCFVYKLSDCRASSPGSVCIFYSSFLQLSELTVCLEGLALPFPNESGFQIFLQTPPSLENHLAPDHSRFESESPGHLGLLLPQHFGHQAVNWIPRGDRANVEGGNCFF